MLQSSLGEEGFRLDGDDERGMIIKDSGNPEKKEIVLVLLLYRHQDGRTAYLSFSKVGREVRTGYSVFSADGKGLEAYAAADGEAKLVRR